VLTVLELAVLYLCLEYSFQGFRSTFAWDA
jgi:hypothetical protein